MKTNIVNKHLIIGGMTCINCQNRIEKKLRQTAGIIKVSVSYAKGTADITYDSDVMSLERISSIIEALDYQVLPEGSDSKRDTNRTLYFLAIILLLYLILQHFGLLNLLVPSRLADSKMSYGMLFIIGLITSVHCIAMCGGINLSQSLPGRHVNTESKNSENVFLPSLLYNLGRIVSYTIIGALLGFIGFLLGGNASTGAPLVLQGIIKLIAGAYMVIMGINMLHLFPGLRKLNLYPPKNLAAGINTRKAKEKRSFIVGLLNGLMPCGPLQSMQIVAFASGNLLSGALSMFCFSLGTVPLMLGLGSLVAALSKKFTRAVMNIGAVLVVVLGLAMLSQGLSLSGLSSGFRSLILPSSDNASGEAQQSEILDGVQVVTSTLSSGEYPDITVQAGTPVKWIINAPDGSINGCNYKMYIQEYGIEYTFQTGENILEFTPDKAGVFSYSCWMGMIHGTISVTDESGTVTEGNASDDAEGNTAAAAQNVSQGEDLVIPISELSTTASFYPAEIDGTPMEVIAVLDQAGNVRTAFNTCQICFSSGRGYYVQSGDKLICQNCGNRFTIDQIEIESGGCNPWPIFAENKTVTEDSVIISYDFLKESRQIFASWKMDF